MSRATPASGFFCGPLQDKAQQLANSGRALQGHQEAMLGHQQGWVQITDPEVLAATGKPITRSCVRGRRTARRLPARCSVSLPRNWRLRVTLASGIQAWVYVSA